MIDRVFFLIGISLSVLTTLSFILLKVRQKKPVKTEHLFAIFGEAYGVAAIAQLYVTVAFNFSLTISEDARFYIVLGGVVIFALIVGSIRDLFVE